ncbi:MAG: hypothetical protein DI598_08595 [Pseudopedobacter saltans]|uniref:CBM-cenC domain-containing protein n=1 Tax=Pseudopedobacter saltans TaxID=151895 RepID=A0A2W5EYP2_9SPHI|nr:MAG: hypothetical protein DI598_08595 [Pseudopedobacter saltans]
MKLKIAALVLGISVSHWANSQKIVRNFGFEYIDVKSQVISWDFVNTKKEYNIDVDSSTAHSGKLSLSIKPKTDSSKDNGAALLLTKLLYVTVRANQKVRITAYAKSEKMTNGAAYIAVQLNGTTKVIDFKKSQPITKNDWELYSVEILPTIDTQWIGFGGMTIGNGNVWFDDFNVYIDDVQVKDDL